jgi:hypothetical protein
MHLGYDLFATFGADDASVTAQPRGRPFEVIAAARADHLDFSLILQGLLHRSAAEHRCTSATYDIWTYGLVGATIGAALAFLVSGHLFRVKVKGFVRERPKFAARKSTNGSLQGSRSSRRRPSLPGRRRGEQAGRVPARRSPAQGASKFWFNAKSGWEGSAHHCDATETSTVIPM